MVAVRQIIEFLQAIDEAPAPLGEITGWADSNVVGINLDRDAGPGELAWISPKQVKRHPERLNSFRGSLLIGPKEVAPAGAESVHYISCLNPKLAFIRVVNEFFTDLTETVWPENGAQPIAPDASIAADVRLAAGVVIGSGVVMESRVTVGPNTAIANCTIKRGANIGANCSIGFPGFGYEKDANGKFWRFPHIGRVVIEQDVEIGSNTCIDRGALGHTIIKSGAKIDNLVHVAHNVTVGRNALVIANSMIGGSTVIGDDVWVAPSVSLMNQISIGKSAILGMGAVVIKDVADAAVMVGNPAKALEKKIT